MIARKSINAALLALLIFSLTFDTVFAECGWNPFCHVVKFAVGDPIDDILPTLEFDGEVDIGVKNVDELQELVRTTSRDIESVSRVMGGEARLTLEKANKELKDSLILLDSLAGYRIADLDQRVQNTLRRIESYTMRVSAQVQEIVRVTSKEMQDVIGITSEEAQQIILTGGTATQAVIGTSGRVMQETVRVTGEELRYSIETASGEIQEIVEDISVETQNVIRTTSNEINRTIDNTIAGLEELVLAIESGTLRVLEGSLIIVERGADLVLAIGSCAAGFIFLFFTALLWGRDVLREKIPERGLTRTFVFVLMAINFLAALLPFGFLSNEARAYALLPMDQANPYKGVGGLGERLPGRIDIQEIDPSRIVIKPDSGENSEHLEVHGSNLLSYGVPKAFYAGEELVIASYSQTSLSFNLQPLTENPQASGHVDLHFGESEADTRRVEVVYTEPELTSQETATIEESTPDTSPKFIVQRPLVNIREWPSTGYDYIGSAAYGEECSITAISPDSYWWKVDCDGKPGWIRGDLGTAENIDNVEVALSVPSTPIPVPPYIYTTTCYYGCS